MEYTQENQMNKNRKETFVNGTNKYDDCTKYTQENHNEQGQEGKTLSMRLINM